MFTTRNRLFAGLLTLAFEGDAGGGQGAAPASGEAPANQGGDGGQNGAGSGSGQQPTETVPYDRFRSVNDEKAAAIARNAELEEKIKSLERRGQSDEERKTAELADAVAAREAAEKRAADLEASQAKAERAGWIRDAATAAKFHDPADAISRLAGEDIKTAAGAERAVKALAEKSAHLINQGDGKQDAGKLLDRVLDPSRTAGQKNGESEAAVIPADQLEAMNTDQLVALQTSDPDLYERSLAAARD